MTLVNWFLVAVCGFASILHPIHISVTDIEFDEKEKSLEIMSRVFMDDLETVLRERYKMPALDVLAPKGRTLDDMMREYFSEKLKISLDRKPQRINYLGHEADGDSFVFYIEVVNVKKWKDIEVTNTLLMEKHPDQSNMVHVTVHGNIKSLRLKQDNPTDKLSFDLK
jgi:hypothetical protein